MPSSSNNHNDTATKATVRAQRSDLVYPNRNCPNPIQLVGEEVSCTTSRSTGHQVGIRMDRNCLVLGVTAILLPSGEPTVGTCSPQRDVLGSVATDTSHTRKTVHIRSDREPIVMGARPKVRFKEQQPREQQRHKERERPRIYDIFRTFCSNDQPQRNSQTGATAATTAPGTGSPAAAKQHQQQQQHPQPSTSTPMPGTVEALLESAGDEACDD